jgi:hypothetical protein
MATDDGDWVVLETARTATQVTSALRAAALFVRLFFFASMVSMVLTALAASTAFAQSEAPASSAQAPAAQFDIAPVAPAAPTPTHDFWDKKNIALFAGVGGARMFDFASTKHFRALGIHEALLNDQIVDNTPLFVGIEAAGTAASIGISYLLHRAGHHSLEHWLSYIHIGVTVYGGVRNYSLTPSTPPAPVGARIR